MENLLTEHPDAAVQQRQRRRLQRRLLRRGHAHRHTAGGRGGGAARRRRAGARRHRAGALARPSPHRLPRHPRPWEWPVRVRADAFGADSRAGSVAVARSRRVRRRRADPGPLPAQRRHRGQEPSTSVTYWHVELSAHGVLLAEGLPAESYLDTGNRDAFANGGAVAMAHPDFARRTWERRAVRRAAGGPALQAARCRLLARGCCSAR